MSTIISVVIFLLVFSILIIVHELGHFIAARRSGVKVEEFGLGLPPRLTTLWTDKHGTRYTLNWIPFGGFVRMYGEDSETFEMQYKSHSFPHATISRRTLIVLGGVLMNFFLGFLIITGLFAWGTKPIIVSPEDFQYYRKEGIIDASTQVMILDFTKNSLAEKAGLKKEDIIVEINGQPISETAELVMLASKNAEKSLQITALRGEQRQTVEVPVSEEGKIGVAIGQLTDVKSIKSVQYPFGTALVQAGYETARLSVLTMKMFIRMIFDFFTKFEISANVSGPVGIAKITYDTAQTGNLVDIFQLIALLSISLGSINVLPIPALDGGRFLSIAYELIARRRPNALWEARIHALGFLLLLLLIFFVTYRDVLKLVSGN